MRWGPSARILLHMNTTQIKAIKDEIAQTPAELEASGDFTLRGAIARALTEAQLFHGLTAKQAREIWLAGE